MPRSVRLLKLFLCLLPLGAHLRAADSTQQLRDQYEGKVFVLRGFPSGDTLHYDSSGAAMEHLSPGIWTTDGFVFVDAAKVDGRSLSIKGRRMLVASHGNGFQFIADTPKKRNKAPVVEITAVLGPNAGSSEIHSLLSKVFLTDQDNFVALVPAYWQTCVAAGLNDVNDPQYSGCHFSAEMLAIPAVKANLDSHAPVQEDPASAQAETVRVFRAGKGIWPPKAIFQPEPEFSSAARSLRLGGGVVSLSLIVDDRGIPRNVEIRQPLGGGLDEEAVRAVSAWKFEPARKDGRPVAVRIEVEIQFHTS